jgi:large subunit ribosomal protein L30e
MDIQRALRSVVSTGKVYLGAAQALKAIDSGEARLVVLAQGSPQGGDIREAASTKGVAFHQYGGRGTELGPACGKPFPVSVLTVLDAGESDILQLAR